MRRELTTVRTGQAHRTLLGHTAPISCLQFDETYLASGSLDKTLRVWDLRMGSVCETLRYDYPVTALQFDSRRILAATGARAVDVSSCANRRADSRYTTARAKSIRRLR